MPRAAASIFPTSGLLNKVLCAAAQDILANTRPERCPQPRCKTEMEPQQIDQYNTELHIRDFCPSFLNCLGLRVFSNSAAIFSYLSSREHQRIELSPCLYRARNCCMLDLSHWLSLVIVEVQVCLPSDRIPSSGRGSHREIIQDYEARRSNHHKLNRTDIDNELEFEVNSM